MTQESKRRVVIDTNRHGIRREINLDKVASRAAKKKKWEANPKWKKDLSTKISTDNTELSTDI